MNAIRRVFLGTRQTRRERAVLGAVVLLAGVCLHTVPAFAAELTTTDADAACSNSDLLQTQFESFTGPLSGIYNQPTGGTEPLLRDGAALTSSQMAPDPPCVWAGNPSVWTYTLNTTVNTSGYDLSQVNLFHGSPDDGRDGMAIKVEFSTVAAPDTFATLYDMGGTASDGSTAHDPPSNYGKIGITAVPADGATGVKKIRITFNYTQNQAVPVSELDVLGTATAIPRRSVLIVR